MSNRYSALCSKIIEGDFDEIRRMIDNGAIVTGIECDTCPPPIITAIRTGENEILKLLLEKGGNPDAKSRDGSPAIFHALAINDNCALQLLCDSGANVKALNSKGESAIFHAVYQRNFPAVKILVEAGCLESAKHVLHFAVRFSSVKICDFLIKSGVPTDARDENGFTPFEIALQNADPRCELFLGTTNYHYDGQFAVEMDHIIENEFLRSLKKMENLEYIEELERTQRRISRMNELLEMKEEKRNSFNDFENAIEQVEQLTQERIVEVRRLMMSYTGFQAVDDLSQLATKRRQLLNKVLKLMTSTTDDQILDMRMKWQKRLSNIIEYIKCLSFQNTVCQQALYDLQHKLSKVSE